MSGMSAGRSAMRMGPAELVQAAAMARRFYLEGKSKIQIAEEFGVSRFKVARVLETALERDLVRIEIRVPAELDAERSDALRARYGLRHAVVVESPADGRGRRRRPGEPRRGRRRPARRAGHRGRCARAWPGAGPPSTWPPRCDRLPPCTVVQLTGVYDAGTAERGSVEAVRRAAAGLRRRGPPHLRADAAARRGDRRRAAQPDRDRPRLRVLRQGHRRLRLHRLLGAGHLHRPRHAHASEERAHYASLGVAAEMSAHLFDAEGRRIGRDLGERCITVEADRLRRIPEVVAIAGGQRKADAIGAVLRSGLVTSLVTDTAAADHLLLETGPGRAPHWTGRTLTA